MVKIIARLREPSTYSGLAGVAILLGMTQEGFAQYVLAVSGLVGFVASVFLPEKGENR